MALKKRLILSTGMADLFEIKDALDVLTKSGTLLGRYCRSSSRNTEYPTPFEDVNLIAMLTIQSAFPGITVGYSDHTIGIEVPFAAVAMGAAVIEKHFTLDRNLPGPDHRASLEPHELTAMISGIRNVEKTLGTGIKKPSPSELKNMAVARKSIVAASSIREGEPFTEKNITVKRPGTGISPMRWDDMIGRLATRNYMKDDPLEA